MDKQEIFEMVKQVAKKKIGYTASNYKAKPRRHKPSFGLAKKTNNRYARTMNMKNRYHTKFKLANKVSISEAIKKAVRERIKNRKTNFIETEPTIDTFTATR